MTSGYDYYQQSYVYFDKEQIQESLDACEKALELGYNADGDVQCSASYMCLVLKKYEDSIAFADESIAINPSNAIAYGNKGISLKALSRYEEAIKCLNESLALDPNNAFCRCHKAGALNHLGKEDEAIEEIKLAQEIMNQNKHTSLLVESDKKFIMDTLESIVGLFKSAKDTQKIIDTLDKNNSAAKKVVEKFTLLKEAKKKVTNKVIDNIGAKQTKASASETETRKQHVLTRLNKNPSQVLSILEEYPEAYTYSETIPYLMKSMSDLQTEANSNIKEIKADVKLIKYSIEELTTDIKNMKQIMKAAGVYDKAKVKQGFEVLYEESPLLHEYAKAFYWTLLNYFAAYRSINTQLIKGNTDTVTNTLTDSMASGLEKASNYLIDMAVEGAKSVPIVGNVISLLDGVVGSIYGAIKEKKLEDRANAINYVIMKNKDPNAVLEEDLSTSIALTALDVAMRKKDDILNPKPANATPTKWQKALDWLNAKINTINEAALGKGIDIYESDAAKAALTDVLLLLAYLYKNYEIISSKSQPLNEQFANIILSAKSNNMLDTASVDPETETSIPVTTVGRSACCTLF